MKYSKTMRKEDYIAVSFRILGAFLLFSPAYPYVKDIISETGSSIMAISALALFVISDNAIVRKLFHIKIENTKQSSGGNS